MTNAALEEALFRFSQQHKFRGKGPLSVALVVTDHAIEQGLPLNADGLITEGGGQVQGLGKARVQSILSKFGLTKVLAEEAGRTSRGSIGKMRLYTAFLNDLAATQPVDLAHVQRFWILRVEDFFRGKPFQLAFDDTISLRAMVRGLLAQAEKRQKDNPGATYVGTLMQHLVGAKLERAMAPTKIDHESASASDQATNRNGDFELGETVIHVTATPGEALFRKCQANLDQGLRPLVITTTRGRALAELNAEQFGLADRIELIEIEQWLASNVLEWSKFEPGKRRTTVHELITTYNAIVDAVESDPSLLVATKL